MQSLNRIDYVGVIACVEGQPRDNRQAAEFRRRIFGGHGVGKRAVVVIGRAANARDFRQVVGVSRRAYVELEVACRNVKLAVVRDAFILCNRDAFGQRQFISKRDIIGRGVSQTIAISNDALFADVVTHNRAEVRVVFAADFAVDGTIFYRAFFNHTDNAADTIVTADFAFDKAIINRSVEIITGNATDTQNFAADVSRYRAVFYRADVVADNTANILLAADICIDEIDIFNRAAVETEQADVIVVSVYLEVADCVIVAVEVAFERIIKSNRRPVRYVFKVNVFRELEGLISAVVAVVYDCCQKFKLCGVAYLVGVGSKIELQNRFIARVAVKESSE